MAILLSLSYEEAQRLRSILQDANEPALLQMIEKELESEKALENLLTDIPDLSLDDLTDIPDISLDLKTAPEALQRAKPDEGQPIGTTQKRVSEAYRGLRT